MIVDWRRKIRMVLNATRMSQAELSRRACISAQALQRWLREKPSGSPDCSESARISDVLGISMDVLFKDRFDLPGEIHLKIQLGSHEGVGKTDDALQLLSQAAAASPDVGSSRTHKKKRARGV